jgi:FAD/FMN-containing dehydrogenase
MRPLASTSAAPRAHPAERLVLFGRHGGHICCGYGLLSRLHGLTVDWLTAVDIVTVDRRGKVAPLTVYASRHPDLFRACRGAGWRNFGMLTACIFDKLPSPPTEVALATLAFDWAAMTEQKFAALLSIYGEYWETRGRMPDMWGLFSMLKLTHRSAGQIVMTVQFCNPAGT